MATATRAGGPKELRLERFTEVLQDPNSRLTYAALTGQRKQSVRDAERLLSQEMVNFMKKHGYILKLNTSVLFSTGEEHQMSGGCQSCKGRCTTTKCN